MKKAALPCVLVVGLVGVAAWAWPAESRVPEPAPCDSSAIIAEYRRAKREEIPPLDRLPEAKRQEAILQYEELVGIVDERIAIRSGQSFEPPVRTGIDAEDARAIEEHVDKLLASMPRSNWDDYRDNLAAAIPALKGESSQTFGQMQDALNRDKAEMFLRLKGCPDDLAKDYGIAPYRP
ncbi:hypothetical protein FKV24_018375 [Lysobacter maris]|uniref:Uncharacterized protein n=1 Tax=Marilutibacter maris TaxID=1605891 RepID=A0A507ZZA5_9GAMM|nr:hypothetical protein [Lysobacter maris]KAB8162459.1 hypothetical protein FKV24_018375 [Lysobacter maris]